MLLNMPGKTKDHENAQVDPKDMGIRPELCPIDDDPDMEREKVKDKELPTACITLSKNEKKEFCEFLKSVKVPFGYSTKVSRLLSTTPENFKQFQERKVFILDHQNRVIENCTKCIALVPVFYTILLLLNIISRQSR
jgi:hypothetical protein